jgi:predicted ATP-dependent protease
MKELTHEDISFDWEKILQEAHPETQTLESIIGQPRGMKALRMGMAIDAKGYNIWMSGATGTGRKTALKKVLRGQELKHPLQDMVYVHNFKHPDTPRAITLEGGKGTKFSKSLGKIISMMKEEIKKALKSQNYVLLRDKMVHEVDKKENHLLSDLEIELQSESFKIVQLEESGENLDIWPVLEEEPVPFEGLQSRIAEGKFTEEEWANLRERYYYFVEKLKGIIEDIRQTRNHLESRLEDLRAKQISTLLTEQIESLRKEYQGKAVKEHLEDLEEDILQNISMFAESSSEEIEEILTNRYDVNVLIDHDSKSKIPVVYEFHPNPGNLFGSLEYRIEPSGETRTSFNMIRAGALHRASGGYLILAAEDILADDALYKSLKKVLETGEVEIFIPQTPFGPSPTSLKPQPFKVQVKVIVLGGYGLYDLIAVNDPDFLQLFKISAEFDSVMPRNDISTKEYLLFMDKTIIDRKLPPITQEGQGAVIEYGVRLAENRKKLSTRFSSIADLLLEASYWAKEMEKDQIDKETIDRALKERSFLWGLREEKMDEMFREKQILLTTRGLAVGQVNGLAVFDVGLSSFGRPVRITATTSPGKEGIINIEGEAGLSGEIHDKGVLILQGLLKNQFAQDFPLAISASVAMEQSYVGVDGDSASSTEIYALISAITGIPLRQDLAVSGSINQMGEIQPVGGITQKVEGFFEVCKQFGLTGTQGVIIPQANINHLVVNGEVQKAVQSGNFHIYAIEDYTEGLSLLTGMPLGEKNEAGNFPEGSLGELIVGRLKILREISQDSKSEG